jgi:hypothetical protein
MVLDPTLMQQWKYAILTNIFYQIRICSFFIHLVWRTYHSTAISLNFPNMKKLRSYAECNSDTIARWNSITLFFYTHFIVYSLMPLTMALMQTITLYFDWNFNSKDCVFGSMADRNPVTVALFCTKLSITPFLMM